MADIFTKAPQKLARAKSLGLVWVTVMDTTDADFETFAVSDLYLAEVPEVGAVIDVDNEHQWHVFNKSITKGEVDGSPVGLTVLWVKRHRIE